MKDKGTNSGKKGQKQEGESGPKNASVSQQLAQQNPSNHPHAGRNPSPIAALPAGGQASQGNQQNSQNDIMQQQRQANVVAYNELTNPMSFDFGTVSSSNREKDYDTGSKGPDGDKEQTNKINDQQQFDKSGVNLQSQIQNSGSRTNNTNQTSLQKTSGVSGSNQSKANFDPGAVSQMQHSSQRKDDFQYGSVESGKDNNLYVTAGNSNARQDPVGIGQPNVRVNDFQTENGLGNNKNRQQHVEGQEEFQDNPLGGPPYPPVQDNAQLGNLQSQSALKTASSQILKTAKSLYQFIVPVAQLNLNKQQSAELDPHQGHQDVLASGQNPSMLPMNPNDLQFHLQRQNKSQAQGAGPRRFGRDVRYASNTGEPLIAPLQHKRELSNSNSHYPGVQGASGIASHQFAQIDSITNFEGAPSTISSRQLTYQQYQQQQQNMGQLNFMSYDGSPATGLGPDKTQKQNLTHRNAEHKNQFSENLQNPQSFRGPHAQAELYQGRLRQMSDNKEASNTVIQNINQMQQKLDSQFTSNRKFLKNFEILLDHYQLKITVHSVQIDIPQSIKMALQASYTPNVYSSKESITKPQAKQTEKRCRVDIINTPKTNGQESQCLKIADFKNQELLIDVYSESEIQYTEAHQAQFARTNQISKQATSKQKCALKLLAISEEKSKLIGVYNYQFHAKMPSKSAEKSFEALSRQAVKFQKSIDKNSSVCISTELYPVKIHSQQDYENMFAALGKNKKMDGDFSQADDMGDETLLSQENVSEGGQESYRDRQRNPLSPTSNFSQDPQSQKSKYDNTNSGHKQQAPQDSSLAKAVRGEQESVRPQIISGKKSKGINDINSSTLPGMRLRGPLASASSPVPSNQASGQKPQAPKDAMLIRSDQQSINLNDQEMKSPGNANNTREINVNASAEPAETVATVAQDDEARLVEEGDFHQPAAKSSSKKAQNGISSNLDPLSHREEFRPKSQSNFQPELLKAKSETKNPIQRPSAQIQKAVTPAIRPNEYNNQRFQYNYVQPQIRPEFRQNNEFQQNQDGNWNGQYNQGDGEAAIEGQSSISKTMNILYEKFQAGVTTVKRALDENQAAYNAASLRRAHSSNQPMQRYNGFNGNNQSLDQTQVQIQFPNQIEGEHLRVRNLFQNVHSPRGMPQENQGARGRPPIPSQFYHGNHPSSRGVSSGRPGVNSAFLEHRKEQINEKTLLNEIETLQQEKKFLQNRLEAQEKQYEDQTKLLNEKIQHQEKKYNKRKSAVNEMKLRLQQQLKNYIEIQQRNENEFKDEYEYMMHLYSHNNQLKDMFEQKFHAASEEKKEVETKLQAEIDELKSQMEQANTRVQSVENERSDAYEQKISIQQEEIEALLNEKQQNESKIKDKDQMIKINEDKVKQQEKQIAQLQEQLKMQEARETTEMKHVSQESALREQELAKLKEKYKEQDNKLAEKQKEFDKSAAAFEAKIDDLNETNKRLEGDLAKKSESLLQKDKQIFKLENDLEQFHKIQNQQKQEAGRGQAALDDLREQNEELMERLRLTESQLIQVKSSWAEAEHEREQFFNQIQEQDERVGALTEQIETQKQTIASLMEQSKKPVLTGADGQQSTRTEDAN